MYPQVYVDLGTMDWGAIPREQFYANLQGLVRAGFGKRIMFGSDQMVWPELIVQAIEEIESAPFLSAEQKHDIFYNNAARFLGLPELPAPTTGTSRGPPHADSFTPPRDVAIMTARPAFVVPRGAASRLIRTPVLPNDSGHS